MRLSDRASFILDYLDRQGTASYEDLAQVLQVSSMTIRRDCEELARAGKLIKTVGGIQQAHAPAYLYESTVRERICTNRAEKRAIAVEALKLIAANHTIFIDGGTTNLVLARLIGNEYSGLTIVTNSALACLEMSQGDHTIIGIGGEYDSTTLSFVGPQAEDFAKSLFVDLAFFSTKAFLPADGTYESSVATLRIKQILARQAVETALLVDHTKFGRRSLSKVLDISQIGHVVTDDRTPIDDICLLKRANVRVHQAIVSEARGSFLCR
jgi:DeoR family transcriptional regulator, aga operon transcriptional repressor